MATIQQSHEDVILSRLHEHPELSMQEVKTAKKVTARLQAADLDVTSGVGDTGEMAVLTVGALHGGTRYNIIPDQAELKLTLRAQKDDVMQQLVGGIRRIVNAEASASRAERPRDDDRRINSSDLQRHDTHSAGGSGVATPFWRGQGDGNVSHLRLEDFSCYGHSAGGAGVPSCFWFVGVTDPKLYQEKQGTVPSVHSPRYAPVRETSLKVGMQALTVAALSQLAAP